MLAVAAEQLVCALPGERDRHMPRRELRQGVESERGEIGEGLVQVPARGPQGRLGRSSDSSSS